MNTTPSIPQVDGGGLRRSGAGRVASAIAVVAIVASSTGCGHYRFDLAKDGRIPPPQETARIGPIEMTLGERRKAITEVGSPRAWGYVPGLTSSDPSVVAVVYDMGEHGVRSRDVFLEAVGEGEARLAFTNAFGLPTTRETWADLLRRPSPPFDPAIESFLVQVRAPSR